MSRIRANNIVNGAGTGAPTFPNGAVINGITTITADVATTGNNLTIGTGTTISNPSDNEFRILTNGGERVRVDSSGNVGIGTTNPQRLLHIYTGDNAQLVLESPDTLNDINLTDTGGSARIRNSGGELRFFTGGDPSSLNVANGSNNVAITTDGNMEIANGNLVFSTAGTGIDFSADPNATGMTGEVLDDYEKGTFTPKYITSNGGDSGIVMLVNNGDYVKIGNLVYVSVQCATSDWTTGVDGNIFIDDFPFAISTTGLNNGSAFNISFRREFATDRGANLTARFVNNNGTKVYLYDHSTTSNTNSNLVHTDFVDGGSENYIYGSGWYFTDE